jgi:alpha-tubulin suppressor-like RCC1 family protein
MLLISRGLAYLLSAGILLLGGFFASPAHATVTPNSGPVTGGTVVTIDRLQFVQVEAGEDFTLGLTNLGTVYSWGRNTYGQLGDGSTTRSNTPIQVKGVGGVGYLTEVTSIATGSYHALALTNGQVVSWGINDYGQLGNASNDNSSVPVLVTGVGGGGLLPSASSVAAGGWTSAAVIQGAVFTWGSSYRGQLGNNSTTDSNLPVQVLGVGGSGFLSNVSSISAGNGHFLVIINSGLVAWGSNGWGQLGDGTTATYSTTPVTVKNVNGTGTIDGVLEVSAGGGHSLALTNTGLFAWGYNAFGQLGIGNNTDKNLPTQVLGLGGVGYLTGVTEMHAASYHSLVVAPGGVLSWGDNGVKALGNNLTAPTTQSPTQVLGVSGTGTLSGITQLAGGNSTSLAISEEGILGWGDGYYGGLGNGSAVNKAIPTPGPRFTLSSASFGGVSAVSPNSWAVTAPPAAGAGVVSLITTANIFGGTVAANPATTAWDAGTFTYEPALAATGSSNIVPLGLASAGALFCGAVLMVGLRRLQKK